MGKLSYLDGLAIYTMVVSPIVDGLWGEISSRCWVFHGVPKGRSGERMVNRQRGMKRMAWSSKKPIFFHRYDVFPQVSTAVCHVNLGFL